MTPRSPDREGADKDMFAVREFSSLRKFQPPCQSIILGSGCSRDDRRLKPRRLSYFGRLDITLGYLK
eukprot:6952578-Pyramimonas_sp.AAC.1